MSFQTRYYDGNSATPHQVTLRQNSLELLGKDSENKILFRWRVTDIHIVQQPSSSSPAIISLNNNPDARLYMEAHDFKALLPLLPKSGKPFHIPANFLSISMWFFAAIFVTAAAFWITPRLAKPIANMIPASWEEAMGEQVVTMMTRNMKTCDTPEGLAALNRITTRLQQNNPDMQGLAYNVRVVDTPNTNAFAAPAGHMVIFSKLITDAESPEELAGVIAHELGHIIKRHPTESAVRSIGLALVMQLMFGADAETVTSVGKYIMDMSYSRDAEHEADDVAITLLKNAQINSNGLVSFFERMTLKKIIESEMGDEASEEEKTKLREALETINDNLEMLEYLSSHPSTEGRIERIKKQQLSSQYPPLLSDTEWTNLQNICNPSVGKNI